MIRDQSDDHVELTPQEARQGFRGGQILVVLAVSTVLAAAALAFFFMDFNAAPGT